MSLVLLKRVLFRKQGQDGACLANANAKGNQSTMRSKSLDSHATQATDAEIDLESQGPSHSASVPSPRTHKRFRINARVISDATIGLSDGLTVPFALTAGLSALGDTKVVIFGGLAELIAGAISMGLGGYLGAKSEA